MKAGAKLRAEVAALLERVFKNEAIINIQDNRIKLVISREVFEHRFGSSMHCLQQLIDEEHPYRTTDIAVLISDSDGRFEHTFKIWKTQ